MCEVVMGNLIESKMKTTWGCPLLQATKMLREVLIHVYNNFIKLQTIISIYFWRLTQQNNVNFHKSKHICDSKKALHLHDMLHLSFSYLLKFLGYER